MSEKKIEKIAQLIAECANESEIVPSVKAIGSVLADVMVFLHDKGYKTTDSLDEMMEWLEPKEQEPTNE